MDNEQDSLADGSAPDLIVEQEAASDADESPEMQHAVASEVYRSRVDNRRAWRVWM